MEEAANQSIHLEEPKYYIDRRQIFGSPDSTARRLKKQLTKAVGSDQDQVSALINQSDIRQSIVAATRNSGQAFASST